MWRSHDEEWERRKSYLIRCLFNDVPYRVLSPVREESTQSFTASSRDGASHSTEVPPQRDTTCSSASYDTDRRVPCAVAPSVDVGTALDERAHSPLPPLIVERAPNKHDDPPEYYRALLTKIRIIYRKMFIENINLSDDEFFYSDHEQHSIGTEVKLARDASSFSDVNMSNGYSGDLDSNQDSTNSRSFEADYNVNDAEETLVYSCQPYDLIEKEREFMLDEDERNNNNINYSDLNAEVTLETSPLNNEEAHYRQITTQAQVHADGSPQGLTHPSPVYDCTAVQTAPDLQSCETATHRLVRDDTTRSLAPLDPTLNVDYEAQSPSCSEIIGNVLIPISGRQSPLEVTYSRNMEDLHVTSKTLFSEEPVGERPIGVSEDHDERIEVRVIEPPDDKMCEDQVTSRAQVARAPPASSRAPHGAALVLRYRRAADRTLVGERETTSREDQSTPATTPSTRETVTSEHEVEVMRAHRPEPTRHSLPLEVTRQSTEMELTSEHITIPRDISSVTSPSQDGCHERASEANSSHNSIDNILTSILNESLNKNGGEPSNRAVASRKRTYKDISMQTDEDVKWNELRTNLFVGPAKIMKLCSCVDHVCY